jgi:hypothetical protein
MGILPSFLSREDQLWTDFATSSRLGYVAADEEVTNRGEDSSKILLDGDWPGTIKGHGIASRIFRSESVSIRFSNVSKRALAPINRRQSMLATSSATRPISRYHVHYLNARDKTIGGTD